MKKFLLVFTLLSLFMLPASVFSYEIPSEWLTVDGSAVTGAPDLNNEDGVFIWATDTSLRNWSIRWTSTGSSWTYWSGVIAMSGQTPPDFLADNPFDITSYSFDSDYDLATVKFADDTVGVYATNFIAHVADSITFVAKTMDGGQDGFDFTIVGDYQPSFIGFDITWGQNQIFVGADATPVEQDFKVAAPASVPEPATMLLLGAGLIGLAVTSRKEVFK